MIALRRYFLVPFDAAEISRGELRLFSEDHLGRLRSQDASGPLAGLLTAMIAATELVFNRYTASLNVRLDAGAEREGDTMAMNLALVAFQDLVRRREGRVKDKFGKPSPGYEEFFPRGLTGYSNATLENAESLMAHMVTASTNHVALVGADMVAEFTAAKAAFVAARGDQTGQSGEVAGAIREREEARDALGVQLTMNVFDLAKMFFRQPERCADFFDQSLLREDVDAEEDEPVPPVPPPGP